MGKIVHLVLTRFNLAIRFGCAKRLGTQCPDFPWLDEEYLERRFRIFEQYTYPSFLNQTDQNFKWIVCFHKDTPYKFKQYIEKYEKEMKNFEAWYFDNNESENFDKIICQYIKENFAGKLISTRVDNDDFVHKRFIEFIKKDFAYQNAMELLAYPNGLQYDSKRNTLLLYNEVNNHFLSLYVANANNDINHILQFNHSEIDTAISDNNIKKLIISRKPSLWVEVITDYNYSNTMGWRFRKLLIPLSYNKEYLQLKTWDGWSGYICNLALGVIQVFENYGEKLFLRLKKLYQK